VFRFFWKLAGNSVGKLCEHRHNENRAPLGKHRNRAYVGRLRTRALSPEISQIEKDDPSVRVIVGRRDCRATHASIAAEPPSRPFRQGRCAILPMQSQL
jgi:hypothetical protein